MSEEQKCFEFSITVVARNREEAENTASTRLHGFTNGPDSWESFGQIKEIPLEKRKEGDPEIEVVFCENLAWDDVKEETYCALGKKEYYSAKCGSECPDFKIKEE